MDGTPQVIIFESKLKQNSIQNYHEMAWLFDLSQNTHILTSRFLTCQMALIQIYALCIWIYRHKHTHSPSLENTKSVIV